MGLISRDDTHWHAHAMYDLTFHVIWVNEHYPVKPKNCLVVSDPIFVVQ